MKNKLILASIISAVLVQCETDAMRPVILSNKGRMNSNEFVRQNLQRLDSSKIIDLKEYSQGLSFTITARFLESLKLSKFVEPIQDWPNFVKLNTEGAKWFANLRNVNWPYNEPVYPSLIDYFGIERSGINCGDWLTVGDVIVLKLDPIEKLGIERIPEPLLKIAPESKYDFYY